MRPLFFLLLAVLFLCGACLPAAGAPLSAPESGEAPACACHDVDPRSDFWKPFVEGQDQTCL